MSDTADTTSVHWVDACVIVGYFVIVFALGFYYGLYKWVRDKWRKYRERRSIQQIDDQIHPDSIDPQPETQENRTTSTSFFLAGKGVGWFAIGCSLFASNIGNIYKFQLLNI
jgi:hypothetical protein